MGYSKAMLSKGVVMSRSKFQKTVTARKAGSSGCQTADTETNSQSDWTTSYNRQCQHLFLLQYKGKSSKFNAKV